MSNSKENATNILESQLRECYGRVVYSHKTQEKCSDILFILNNIIQMIQIILSALVAGSFLPIIFGKDWKYSIVGCTCSTILLFINLYIKKNNLYDKARKHKDTANNLWIVRERFLSLIVDLRTNQSDINKIQKKRDEINIKLFNIYKKAPSANFLAYKLARKALKIDEEMTFSNSEIDQLIPEEIRLHKS